MPVRERSPRREQKSQTDGTAAESERSPLVEPGDRSAHLDPSEDEALIPIEPATTPMSSIITLAARGRRQTERDKRVRERLRLAIHNDDNASQPRASEPRDEALDDLFDDLEQLGAPTPGMKPADEGDAEVFLDSTGQMQVLQNRPGAELAEDEDTDLAPRPYEDAYKHTKGDKWTKEELKTFYTALRTFGQDCDIIKSLFANKTIQQVKRQLKRERKNHPDLIRLALTEKVHALTTDAFEAANGQIEWQEPETLALEEEAAPLPIEDAAAPNAEANTPKPRRRKSGLISVTEAPAEVQPAPEDDFAWLDDV